MFWKSHKATDPICGMQVDDRKAARREIQGKAYYFCSEACASIATQNPHRISEGEKPPKIKEHDMGSTPGCCT